MAKVTLLNKGPRTYQTKHGDLGPNETLVVDDVDAKELLDYRDIVKLKAQEEPKSEDVSESKAKGDTPAKSGKK